MNINEKYKIKSDENNIIICEKYIPKEGKKAGKDTMETYELSS